MEFRFLLIVPVEVPEDELPSILRGHGPMPSLQVTDMGLVHEDDLVDKLRYFYRGTGSEWHDKILITRYPDARVTMSLSDMCRVLGIN